MEDTTESIGKDQLQQIKKFKRKLGGTLLEEVKLPSSPTPNTVSISNAPRPFWTNACLEESALLWSPRQVQVVTYVFENSNCPLVNSKIHKKKLGCTKTNNKKKYIYLIKCLDQ